MGDSSTMTLVLWALGGAAAGLLVLASIVVWRNGRPFAEGSVLRASRWSSGNHLFPTQVLITPTSVVQYTPRWIGKSEESIHLAHVASVRIDTNLLFSNVCIETSGGSDPISCYGHFKADADRMKQLIEEYQSAHYRARDLNAPSSPSTRSATSYDDAIR